MMTHNETVMERTRCVVRSAIVRSATSDRDREEAEKIVTAAIELSSGSGALLDALLEHPDVRALLVLSRRDAVDQRQLVCELAIRLARFVLWVWRGRYLVQEGPEKAVEAAEAWVQCPCPAHADAAHAAQPLAIQQAGAVWSRPPADVAWAARTAAWAADAPKYGWQAVAAINGACEALSREEVVAAAAHFLEAKRRAETLGSPADHQPRALAAGIVAAAKERGYPSHGTIGWLDLVEHPRLQEGMPSSWKADPALAEDTLRRLAIRLAREVLPQWMAEHSEHDGPLRAVEAAEAWQACPCESHQTAAWEAAFAASRQVQGRWPDGDALPPKAVLAGLVSYFAGAATKVPWQIDGALRTACFILSWDQATAIVESFLSGEPANPR